MSEPRWRVRRRLALAIDAVEVLPTDLDSFLVRVAGSWEGGGERPEARPELVFEVEGEQRRFAALAETSGAAEKVAREAQAFRATFSVPEALRAELSGALRLAVGDVAIELPPARLPEAPPELAPGATVIDRAVLAERRARRAELAEEATSQRAQEAEGALGELESELAKLELRLERAVAERAALAEQAAEHEREARAATQREYAERRRRQEASEEASEQAQEADLALRDLRTRLREAERRASSLARQAEELRRRAAEAEHAVITADAARARAEQTAVQLGDQVESLQELTEQLAAARAEATAPPLPPPAAGAPPPADPVEVLRTESALARRVIGEAASMPIGRRPTDDRPERAPAERRRADEAAEAQLGAAQVKRALGAVSEAERWLRDAAATVNRTAAELRAERQAHGGLAAELERERSARVTAERAVADARVAAESADRRASALQQRLDDVVADLRSELGALRDEPRSAGDHSDLREFVTTAAEALRQAEGRIQEAHRAAASLSQRIEELEGQLLVERAGRERAEAALRVAPPPEPSPARPRPPAAVEPDREAEPAKEAEPVAPDEVPAGSWLPAALERMLERKPAEATVLLLDLVAGQGLHARRPLDYRLSVPGEGMWSVSLRPGRGVVARMDQDPVPADWGEFELAAEPRALLDVLVDGGSRRVRRRVKIAGTRRRRRALRALPPAELRPGRLAAGEIWLDPLLLLKALAELVDPAWTGGQRFVVAHHVEGPRGRSVWVRVRHRTPLEVLAEAPDEEVAVTINSTQAAFQRFLGGEPAGAEKSAIRGDARMLAEYTGWLERARSAHGAEIAPRPGG
jgi:hypothetical protein